MSKHKTVAAIDPGRSKCGIAVVKSNNVKDYRPIVIHHSVIDTSRLPQFLLLLIDNYSPEIIIIGNGTSSSDIVTHIREICSIPIQVVDEKYTSELARKRFFNENPPRGWRKLIPTSLQTPDRPYDNYVAIILAERYLTG